MMQPESCKSHCSVISRQRPLDSIWEERVLPHGEERGNKKHMLGGVRIPFPFGEGERKPQRTRWKHSFSSDYLSSYTGTFVWLFLMQKLDARPCCHYETWSAGKFHSRSPFFPPPTKKQRSLTLDIEGGIGGLEGLSCDGVFGDAHKAPRVLLAIHGGELEVAALQEAARAL